MLRRTFLALATGVAALGLGLGGVSAQDLPKLKQKDKYKVGFAQTESNNPWRIAQTESMKAEAAKLGHQLVYTDAAGSAAKQVADVNSMIAQGVDLIFLAPREEKPLIPAVMAAKKAGIPVILLDRNVDQILAKAGEDYVTFIGSDFIDEGKRVAEWLTKDTTASPRSSSSKAPPAPRPPTTARRALTMRSTRPVRLSPSSHRSPATSPATRAARSPRRCCRRIPMPTSIYAHNDEMAMGAIAALEAAGKKPGKDVHRGVDRRRQGSGAGRRRRQDRWRPSSATEVRPEGFETLARYANGEKIEPWVKNTESSTTSRTRPAHGDVYSTSSALPGRCRQRCSVFGQGNGIFMAPLLTMQGVDKRFAGIPALRAAELVVEKGEVHALIGQNGAGKSTMIKSHRDTRPDAGEIVFDGKPPAFSSPQEAQGAGISTIYRRSIWRPTDP